MYLRPDWGAVEVTDVARAEQDDFFGRGLAEECPVEGLGFEVDGGAFGIDDENLVDRLAGVVACGSVAVALCRVEDAVKDTVDEETVG